jgi:trehalose synthase-fused probable maltokinase
VVSEAAATSIDGWHFTIDHLTRFFERAAAADRVPTLPASPATAALLDLAMEHPPPPVRDAIGDFLDWAETLGERTAELHAALKAQTADSAFAAEPFSYFARRARYQSLRALTGHAFRALRGRLPALPADERTLAEDLFAAEQAILQRFRALVTEPITASIIRVHGDFRLEQVLVSDDTLVIIDFEGDPARPLAERRLKRVPMRDVAGMLRSFAHAVEMARPARPPEAEAWGRVWFAWVAAAYLRGYSRVRAGDADWRASAEQIVLLIDIELLALALEELEATAARAAPEDLAYRLRRVLRLLEPVPSNVGSADP